jgi:preprotein translocase subunit SecG
MLSFIKEQPSSPEPGKDAGTAETGTNIAAKVNNEQEYFTVSTRNKDLRKSTMMLIVLFAIGLICLFFMIKKSTPKSASAAETATEQTQIEATIARMTGIKSEMYNRMDEIVNKFYEFSDVLQVQVSELVKNPFQLEAYLAGLKNQPVINQPAFEIDTDMIRIEQIKQKAKDMSLVSIMQSDKGMCCMISNRILYRGDTIKDFTISEIGDYHVKLQCEGVEIVLNLPD